MEVHLEYVLKRNTIIPILFIISSTWCTLFNKYLLEDMSSTVLMFTQNTITVVVLLVLKGQGLIESEEIVSPHLVLYNKNKLTLWVGITYSFNVMFGLWSLKFLTIPLFGVLKRSTIIVVWVLEVYLLNSNGAFQCLKALLVMLLGTVIAAWFDVNFSSSSIGYIFATLSCFAQGIAFVLSKKVASKNKKKGGSSSSAVWSSVYFNACVSVLLMSVVMLWRGEWSSLILLTNPLTAMLVLANGASIIGMNYTIFLNCTVNSPLSHAVSGNMKALITTVVGFVLFPKPISSLGGVGIMLNFIGGTWYSYIKYLQQIPILPTYSSTTAADSTSNHHNNHTPLQPLASGSSSTSLSTAYHTPPPPPPMANGTGGGGGGGVHPTTLPPPPSTHPYPYTPPQPPIPPVEWNHTTRDTGPNTRAGAGAGVGVPNGTGAGVPNGHPSHSRQLGIPPGPVQGAVHHTQGQGGYAQQGGHPHSQGQGGHPQGGYNHQGGYIHRSGFSDRSAGHLV